MNLFDKNVEKRSRQIQIPVGEQSQIFLQVYSSDLKYMAPWSQYESSEELCDNSLEKKISNNKIVKNLQGEIQINNKIIA